MKSKMADNQPNRPVSSVSSLVERLLEIVMKDVDDSLNVEKAPKSCRVKGYKFFVEGFIHEFQGLRTS